MRSTPANPGTVDEKSIIGRRVTVQAGAQIINSEVRGPSIIGENAASSTLYLGPIYRRSIYSRRA